jgi:uncharacterized protein
MSAALKDKFNDLLHESMKNHDDVTRDTMRMVLTNLKLTEVDKQTTLDDTAILGIVQKEIKSRNESIEEFKKGNRPDLIERTAAEIKVLEQFLPKQLSDDEIRLIIEQAISESGATSISEMGKVMKIALPKMQGKAASDRVSSMVKQLLQK